MSRFDPPVTAVSEVVERALSEDLEPLGDLTASLLPPDERVKARIVSRDHGTLAGCACARETFTRLDPSITQRWNCDDGDVLAAGTVVAEIEGSLAGVVSAERTALNFLMHLSGIATLTARFVERAAPLRVWDTRKTTPGLRALEKAAVRAGGGAAHRGNLSDWIMLKDNHLAGMSIADAVARSHDLWPARTVHVECDRIEQMGEALDAGADAILLDNMTPDEVRNCVALASEHGSSPLLEVSGGIDLETVGSYADSGADIVSTSAITLSAPAFDLGMDLDPSEATES